MSEIAAFISILSYLPGFEYLVGLVVLTSVMAWVMGHLRRLKRQKNPLWVTIAEKPVGILLTILSFLTNITVGLIWGLPSRETLTFTQRLEYVVNSPKWDGTFRGRLARYTAKWVNFLWMGHIDGV